MQRVLSVQTSRSGNDDVGSESVTKRLCCSFLFVVAFFSILGGFMLGRYAAERTIANRNANLNAIHDRLVSLYGHLSHRTFHAGECSCNRTAIFVRCNFTEEVQEFGSAQILNLLAECFKT